MKFTTSENRTHGFGIGYVPKSWINYDLDHDDSILKYFRENIKIYDADNAGYETHDFVFEDGKAFRLEYERYLNIYNEVDEFGEEPYLIDNIFIEEISLEEADVPEKKCERD